MKRLFLVLPLLAACATPREACISQASQQLMTIDALVIETQDNIARGYALATQQQFVPVQKSCTVMDSNSQPIVVPCNEVEVNEVQVPVAIDLNAERAKLASLLERQRQMRGAVDAAVANCIATHPE